ncbi:hypothetical protein J2785_006745 [Burkholderia ambifaria]|nr:hypothetical protein [Burkholderia ambifaria]MDR6503552.1 hypothetical protein [Burkholderia ambifaria]
MRLIKPLVVVLAFIFAFLVWNSDGFQRWAFPRTFWEGRAHQTEQDTTMWRTAISQCTLEVESSLRTFDLDVAKLMNAGESREEAVNTKREAFQLQVVTCQGFRSNYEQATRELTEARQHLATLK